MRFAANLSMLFTEVPFPERFAAARKAGFEGVEYLFPYDWPKELLAEKLSENGLQQVLFNLPPGDWAAGDRGLAGVPGREGEFREGIVRALDYADALGCKRLHAMAGVKPDGASLAACWDCYRENIAFAADMASARGVTILLEPINTQAFPGYLLSMQEEARRVIRELGRPNLGLQLDFYHAQIMEGDLTRCLQEGLDVLRHVQIAGVPERHEPDSGEVNYSFIFRKLAEAGYNGWIGCEYNPRTTTEAGLSWREPLSTAHHSAD